MKLYDIREEFRRKLSTPRCDIFFNLILEHWFNLPKHTLPLFPEKELDSISNKKIFDALDLLVKDYPIQYILGEMVFHGHHFIVNPNVLIPRPETEELVQWIIEEEASPTKILDICTGSGCIAISLAHHFKNTQITAIDISKEALQVCKENLVLNNVDVELLEIDILSIDELSDNYDIIVSNPPYVMNIEKGNMSKNVLNYEPHLSLFVPDTNPLLFYEKISSIAKNHLSSTGSLYFEINEQLGKKTVEMLKDNGFSQIELKKDLFKKDRFIRAFL